MAPKASHKKKRATPSGSRCEGPPLEMATPGCVGRSALPAMDVGAGPARPTRRVGAVGLCRRTLCMLVLLQTMKQPQESHCSIMSHELKYIINILDKLILLLRQKAYSPGKWGKFPNNNEEFLSLQTILYKINNCAYSPQTRVPQSPMKWRIHCWGVHRADDKAWRLLLSSDQSIIHYERAAFPLQ